MKRLLFLLLFGSLTLTALPKAEFYVTWAGDVKGRKDFERVSGTSTLYKGVDLVFQEKGMEVEYFDKDLYLKDFRKPKGKWQKFLKWISFKEAPMEPIEDVVLYLFWGLDKKTKKIDFSLLPKEKLCIFLWEPVVVQKKLYEPEFLDQFGKIFTFNDDLVDNKRFFKFHYPELRKPIDQIVPFKEKKLCTLINSMLSSSHPLELYSKREEVIQFFEDKPAEFDLYGRYWKKRNYKNYKGEIPDKVEVLKGYKFSVCYENTKDVPGYITEKIFDCFHAGVVPIYLGAPNVEEYIPKACFIDRRDFKDFDAVYSYLKEMSEEKYQEYLESAKAYVMSDQAKVFTEEYLINRLAVCLFDEIEQDPAH